MYYHIYKFDSGNGRSMTLSLTKHASPDGRRHFVEFCTGDVRNGAGFLGTFSTGRATIGAAVKKFAKRYGPGQFVAAAEK